MRLLSDVHLQLFDTKTLKRGCAVRFKNKDGTIDRLGLVYKVNPEKMTVLYANVQNSATSYFDLNAKDVVKGEWEVFWSQDLEEVHHEHFKPEKPPETEED